MTSRIPNRPILPTKIHLFPGDPLIGVLKRDLYVIVNPNTFETEDTGSVAGRSSPYDDDDDDGTDDDPDDGKQFMVAPMLGDIKWISSKMITDMNKNQYVEFIFNVRNRVGDSVIGAKVHGQ